MTCSAVTTTRTVLVISLMLIAIISERGLASTFRKPILRLMFPISALAAQHGEDRVANLHN